MATTFGGSSRHHIKSADLQLYVNTRAMNILNAFCKRTQAVNALYNFDHTTVLSSNRNQAEIKDSTTISEEDWTKSSVDGTKRSQSKVKEKSDRRRSSGMFLPEIHDVHPLLHHLHENIATASIKAKNVELLTEVERICVLLEGCRVTFCKSGKDRTGMAVTLEQSRQLGERFCCGLSTARLMKDANLFRLHGTRLLIAEKNIGRRVYSINKLQAQFLPPLYRPPPQTCEDLMKKDNS